MDLKHLQGAFSPSGKTSPTKSYLLSLWSVPTYILRCANPCFCPFLNVPRRVAEVGKDREKRVLIPASLLLSGVELMPWLSLQGDANSSVYVGGELPPNKGVPKLPGCGAEHGSKGFANAYGCFFTLGGSFAGKPRAPLKGIQVPSRLVKGRYRVGMIIWTIRLFL